jgi:hypothetical protein
MNDYADYLTDLSMRIQRLCHERINGTLGLVDVDKLTDIAKNLSAAAGRLWSAYPAAGHARSELRILFDLLGETPPEADTAPEDEPECCRQHLTSIPLVLSPTVCLRCRQRWHVRECRWEKVSS